jgi:hypothetical protein
LTLDVDVTDTLTYQDVGHSQLADRLRSDPRVLVKERFNLRNLTPADLPEQVHLMYVCIAYARGRPPRPLATCACCQRLCAGRLALRRTVRCGVGGARLDGTGLPRCPAVRRCRAQVDGACLDLSFISVLLVIAAVASVLKPHGWLVVLIKPQVRAGWGGQLGRSGRQSGARSQGGVQGRAPASPAHVRPAVRGGSAAGAQRRRGPRPASERVLGVLGLPPLAWLDWLLRFGLRRHTRAAASRRSLVPLAGPQVHAEVIAKVRPCDPRALSASLMRRALPQGARTAWRGRASRLRFDPAQLHAAVRVAAARLPAYPPQHPSTLHRTSSAAVLCVLCRRSRRASLRTASSCWV